jgi:hypothetical protein
MWQVKAEIKKSRVGVTAKVVEAINAAPMELKPRVLVSSTAVGYYGTSETSAFDETSPSGKDYLAEVRKSSLPTNITLTQSVRISVSSLMTHSYFEISICPLTTYGTFKQTFRTQRWVRYPILVTFDSFLQGKTDDYFFCRR